MVAWFYIISIVIIFCSSCDETQPNDENIEKAECSVGFYPCDDDSTICCEFVIPSSKTQTSIDWPSLADSPWPMFMHDPQLTGRSHLSGPREGSIDTVYTPGGELYSNPSIDSEDNILFISNTGFPIGDSYLISINDSSIKNWDMNLGNGWSVGTPLITSDYYLYLSAVNNNTGYLFKSDLSGNIVWTYSLGSFSNETNGSVNISKDGNLVFVAGFGGSLYAVKKDGNLEWNYVVKSGITIGNPAMSIDGEQIYFVSNEPALYCVSLNGDSLWKRILHENSEVSTINPCVDSDGNIYVYSGENLYSFSSEGYLRWQYQGLSNGYALNGISIGIDGSLFISTLSDFYCFSYGGFFKWSMNILQYNSGISTIPTSDINGYSFLAIDNTDV
jgi:hypothetical protein